jgi:hypothetical protein
MYLEDGDIVHIIGNEYTIKSDGVKISRNIEDMDIEALQSSK